MSRSIGGMLISALAGLSTILGALPVLFIKDFSPRLFASGLSLASGIMIYISFIEIFQEGLLEITEHLAEHNTKELPQRTLEAWAFLFANLAFLCGYVIAGFMDRLIHMYMVWRRLYITKEDGNESIDTDRHSDETAPVSDHEVIEKPPLDLVETKSSMKKLARFIKHCWFYLLALLGCTGSHIDTPPTPEDLSSFDDHMTDYLQVGLSTTFALMLHNFPEGIATYSGFVNDPRLGIGLATAIAIHNIPEGFSVAIPIYLGTGSKRKAFAIASLSGLAETFASIFAYLVIPDGKINALLFGVLYCVLAGLMSRVAIKELLVTSIRFDRRGIYVVPCFFLGTIIMGVSLMAFQMIYAEDDALASNAFSIPQVSAKNEGNSFNPTSNWSRKIVTAKKHLFNKRRRGMHI